MRNGHWSMVNGHWGSHWSLGKSMVIGECHWSMVIGEVIGQGECHWSMVNGHWGSHWSMGKSLVNGQWSLVICSQLSHWFIGL